jgi:hypothetical protein
MNPNPDPTVGCAFVGCIDTISSSDLLVINLSVGEVSFEEEEPDSISRFMRKAVKIRLAQITYLRSDLVVIRIVSRKSLKGGKSNAV